MLSSQKLPPGDEHVLPVDAKALKQHTLATDGAQMQATCDLVRPLPFACLSLALLPSSCH